eukprot:tig00000042_g15450.t1
MNALDEAHPAPAPLNVLESSHTTQSPSVAARSEAYGTTTVRFMSARAVETVARGPPATATVPAPAGV